MEEPRNIVNTQVGLNRFLTKMYGWMAAAVVFSGVIAFLAATAWQPQLIAFLNNRIAYYLIFGGLLIFTVVGQRSALSNPLISFLMLFLFAGFFGFTFGAIFLIYQLTTIASAFFAAAAVFAVMSIIGLTTKRDISKLGTQLMAALIAMIIVSLVNAIFLKSPMVVLVFSVIGIIVFAGLSMYNTAQMKNLYLQYGNQVSETGLAIQGAFSLYLDFINLFQYFLTIFGWSSRD